MKLIFILTVIVLLTSCSPSEYTEIVHKCNEGHAQSVAKFTLECIKNANPHSDEEPEDWIRQCQGMAKETFCPKMKLTKTKQQRSNGAWVELSRKYTPL